MPHQEPVRTREIAKRKQLMIGTVTEHELQEELYRRQSSGNFIADVVFGANDGIVTTFTLVAGVAGAGLSPVVTLVLGLVNLLGDGLSMGFGNYLGIRSRELYEHGQRQREEWEVDNLPEVERAEIRRIFSDWGFTGTELDSAVATITADRTRWVDFMMMNELNIAPEATDTPMKHGLVTFTSFVVAGVVPLMPYIIGLPYPATSAVVLSGATLFIVGALRAYFVPIRWWRAGLEMFLIGSLAGGLGYGIGAAFQLFTGIG